MPKLSYQKALDAGYSQEEIHSFLAQNPDVELLNGQERVNQTAVLKYAKALDAGYSPDEVMSFAQQNPGVKLDKSQEKQDSMLSQSGPVTEKYGQYQPDVEVFSHGITNGLGVGVPVGTKVATPPGKWKVVSSYGGAVGPGYIGNGENSGYGNSALIKNVDTGETLRYSHLMSTYAESGQLLDGNTVIGKTGATGNVTGPHLNLEYYDADGKLGDVLHTSYAKYLPTQGDNATP